MLNDSIALLLPTRGRPAALLRALGAIDAQAAGPERVVVVVGVDDDDAATAAALDQRRAGPVRVLPSIGAREVTLGALWNRLAREPHGCDILAMTVDDYVMATPGFDERYRTAVDRMPMGYGAAWPLDPLHPDICTAPIVTRRLVELQGFFVPPWFPFWFHDSWYDELGAMLGCRQPLEARIEAPDGRGRTQHMRDLVFWATLFEALQPRRLELARALLPQMYGDRPALALTLEHHLEPLAMYYSWRRARLRDPAFAARLEHELGTSEPSPRYHEAKRQAEALLETLGSPA